MIDMSMQPSSQGGFNGGALSLGYEAGATREAFRPLHDIRLHSPPSTLLSAPVFQERALPEIVFEALATAKIFTSSVAMHIDRQTRAKIFRQIDLLHDFSEWEEGDRPMSQPSFISFLKGLMELRPAVMPSLGMTSTGNIIAAWLRAGDRLTIEFMQTGLVRLLASHKYDDVTQRVAVETSRPRLLQAINSLAPGFITKNEVSVPPQ